MHGQFCWYDLMTTDVEAAKRFYTSLGGWSTQFFEKSQPGQPYTLWMHKGNPIGGVMQLGPEQRSRGIPPMWLPSVEVSDVDASARKAESLGGKVHAGPMDVPDTGRYALVQDPQGAMIGIFKPIDNRPMPSTFDGTPQAGRVSWHELMTTDYKRAADFYRQLFGWEKVAEMDMGPGGMYYEYGLKGKMYGGMYNRPAEMSSIPPFWLNYIFTNDLQQSLDKAQKAGAKIVNGPMDIPGGGSIVVLADPQGAGIALHSNKPLPQKTAGAAKSAGTTKARKKTTAKKASRARSKGKKTARRSSAKAKSRPKAAKRTKAKARSKKKARRR